MERGHEGNRKWVAEQKMTEEKNHQESVLMARKNHEDSQKLSQKLAREHAEELKTMQDHLGKNQMETTKFARQHGEEVKTMKVQSKELACEMRTFLEKKFKDLKLFLLFALVCVSFVGRDLLQHTFSSVKDSWRRCY